MGQHRGSQLKRYVGVHKTGGYYGVSLWIEIFPTTFSSIIGVLYCIFSDSGWYAYNNMRGLRVMLISPSINMHMTRIIDTFNHGFSTARKTKIQAVSISRMISGFVYYVRIHTYIHTYICVRTHNSRIKSTLSAWIG